MDHYDNGLKVGSHAFAGKAPAKHLPANDCSIGNCPRVAFLGPSPAKINAPRKINALSTFAGVGKDRADAKSGVEGRKGSFQLAEWLKRKKGNFFSLDF